LGASLKIKIACCSIPSQYLKFSFEVIHWDFLSALDKLQFVLMIQPAFNSTQIRSNSPQVGITTILLETIGAQQPDAVLRVLDYALAGPAFTQPVTCTQGWLIFTFDFFGNQTSLLYDPGSCFPLPLQNIAPVRFLGGTLGVTNERRWR